MGHFISEQALRYQEYITRENNIQHHTYEEEMTQFEFLRAGDPRAMDEYAKAKANHWSGTVSADPLRNQKYLTVVSIAMACRAAIQGGVDAKRAYDISDLYIRQMDVMEDIEKIQCLERDMFAFYLKEVMSLAKKRSFSKPVSLCLDYIYNHLHEPVTVQALAELTGLNPSYLSSLFKKEMGQSISEYIMSKKMEAARNMLRYTDSTSAEISTILNFSSQSHFIRTFKKHTGDTPKQYREKNYRLLGETEESACSSGAQ